MNTGDGKYASPYMPDGSARLMSACTRAVRRFSYDVCEVSLNVFRRRTAVLSDFQSDFSTSMSSVKAEPSAS